MGISNLTKLPPFILLASSSPRRVELLKQITPSFKVIPNKLIHETRDPKDGSLRNQLKKLCYRKAIASKNGHTEWILTADTIVIHNNHILEKPRSLKDAKNMLTQLSGQSHRVMTAVCFYHPISEKRFLYSASSQVTFSNLTKQDINHYVSTCKPLDKAGGYGFQELPSHFIASYKGSKYTIIGLPLHIIKQGFQDIHRSMNRI